MHIDLLADSGPIETTPIDILLVNIIALITAMATIPITAMDMVMIVLVAIITMHVASELNSMA